MNCALDFLYIIGYRKGQLKDDPDDFKRPKRPSPELAQRSELSELINKERV